MTRRRCLFLCCYLIGTTIALSQTATVTRNVYLRPDPSTSHSAITKLLPPAQIQLLEESPTDGFYHVQSRSQSGWVWGRNIKLQAVPSTGLLIEPTPVGAIPGTWEKGTPQNTVFTGSEGACAESGEGGDSATNLLKNRLDVPTAYHYVTWDAINAVPYPHGATRSRSGWTQAQRNVIAPFEGVAVAVEGFLYKVKVESSSANATSGGETTNCHAHLAADVDWHMPLTAASGQGENLAVIVETTPRLRQSHTNWTVARLKPWTENVSSHPNAAFNGQPVRIFGWLMLDPEHNDMITEGLRSTLWEIHPITRIEVFQNGQWVDADSLP